MRGVSVIATCLRWDAALTAGNAGREPAAPLTATVAGVDASTWVAQSFGPSPVRARPVVVVPGDLAGLQAPTLAAGTAVRAGAVVVLVPQAVSAGAAVALVPTAGSHDVLNLEPHSLTATPAVGDLATANRALTEAMRVAAQSLTSADLAGYDDAGRQRVVDATAFLGPVPAGSDPAAIRLLHTALVVSSAVDAARQGDGPAASARSADLRAQILGDLAAQTRRAVEAAAAVAAGRPIR